MPLIPPRPSSILGSGRLNFSRILNTHSYPSVRPCQEGSKRQSPYHQPSYGTLNDGQLGNRHNCRSLLFVDRLDTYWSVSCGGSSGYGEWSGSGPPEVSD